MQIVDGQIRSFADSTEKELRKAHNLRKMYQAGRLMENMKLHLKKILEQALC
jgi:hypothetical protein